MSFAEGASVGPLVNNAAEPRPERQREDISSEPLERTFRTNVFAYLYMTRAVLKYIPE